MPHKKHIRHFFRMTTTIKRYSERSEESLYSGKPVQDQSHTKLSASAAI
jgi:hypothetical protein